MIDIYRSVLRDLKSALFGYCGSFASVRVDDEFRIVNLHAYGVFEVTAYFAFFERMPILLARMSSVYQVCQFARGRRFDDSCGVFALDEFCVEIFAPLLQSREYIAADFAVSGDLLTIGVLRLLWCVLRG